MPFGVFRLFVAEDGVGAVWAAGVALFHVAFAFDASLVPFPRFQTYIHKM
jgi:hypothetical protein